MHLNKAQRALLKQKFGGHCAYCGIVLTDKWQADHLIPIIRDWERVKQADGSYKTIWLPCQNPEFDTFDNLMPSCPKCNKDKASMPLEGWRDIIKNKVRLLRNDSRYDFALRFGLVEEKESKVSFFFETYDNDYDASAKGDWVQ